MSLSTKKSVRMIGFGQLSDAFDMFDCSYSSWMKWSSDSYKVGRGILDTFHWSVVKFDSRRITKHSVSIQPKYCWFRWSEKVTERVATVSSRTSFPWSSNAKTRRMNYENFSIDWVGFCPYEHSSTLSYHAVQRWFSTWSIICFSKYRLDSIESNPSKLRPRDWSRRKTLDFILRSLPIDSQIFAFLLIRKL